MQICEVVGHVWATKKEEALVGMKLMIVRELGTNPRRSETSFVAADTVGAGVGERVLVVSGSTARIAAGGDRLPVDAAIVGIIDSLEADCEKGNGEHGPV
ncbi:MAG: EutN/CcmL family microcompartment protein [Clostridiales Family XIII bacterium]|jgi:ethanolamine utilization protein EutN|nr:EutN/CcmL family microcompartment protein [Clostridiales Family XIII bacterium]